MGGVWRDERDVFSVKKEERGMNRLWQSGQPGIVG